MGEGFAAASLDAKAMVDTLNMTVRVEHHSNLVDTLGMGMELRVAENHAKMNWIGSKAIVIMRIGKCLLRGINDPHKYRTEV